MAEDRMAAARWRAGRAFLDALEAHGFALNGALWLFDRDGERWELALVTPLVDAVGATEIYTTLFAAQDGGLLPAAPSAWDVSVNSPVVMDGLDLGTDGERAIELGSRLARPSWTYFTHAAGAVDESAWQTFRRRADAAAEEVVPSA